MRAWVALLFIPVAGCLGTTPLTVITDYAQLQALVEGDPTPIAAQDCSSLLDTLNERALEEARVALQMSVEGRYGWRGGWLEDGVTMVDAAADAPALPSAGSARDADVTGTNNQEAGVDEADILKTDGEWTYVIRDRAVYILHSQDVGDVEEYAMIPLEANGGALLLEDRDPDDPDDDRLVVITRPWGIDVPVLGAPATSMIAPEYSHRTTRIAVYDLADRSDPALLQETFVEGEHVGARLIDGTAYIVAYDWADGLGLRTWAHPSDKEVRDLGLTFDAYYSMSDDARRAVLQHIADRVHEENKALVANATLADHLPLIARGTGVAVEADRFTDERCQRVQASPDTSGRGVSTIVAIDVDGSLDSSTTQILTDHPLLYGAEDAIVLATRSHDFWWFWDRPRGVESTDLHWFDLDGLQVEHRASGRIAGIVQDQFGIDVHDGELRVATTTGTWGRWWLSDPEPMANHVAVLEEEDGGLAVTGAVSGIAPGERIWSARFTDDRAYLITFEQIDPLWIIDLEGTPRILGELEIPGVSTYIHPLDDDTLLTIGYGPGPLGEGLDWSRIQVSLFDISDPSRPERADVLDVSPPGGHSWSGATREHKAFTYWGALGMLAIPVTTTQPFTLDCEFGCRETYRYSSGLRLVEVDADGGTLSTYGSVDQDTLGTDRYWGYGIERTYFLGFPDGGPVSIYSMSGLGVTAHDVDTLDLQDFVAFDI